MWLQEGKTKQNKQNKETELGFFEEKNILLAATGTWKGGKLLVQGSSADLEAAPMVNVTQMNAKRSNL